jgi:putative peptidoglycan lipid II flippase
MMGMLGKIFRFQSKTITLSAFIVAASYLISAVLGLLRDRLLAGRFGAGSELDAYFAAFRVPDFIFNILILGGLTFAFLPLFSEYFTKNKEEAWRMTNYVLNIFLFLLVILSLILFAITPLVAKFIFPGFTAQETKLFIPLARILFLSPIFFLISSILSSVLQYFRRFLVYSLAPIFYNLGIIFGIIFLTPHFGIFGVAIGVVIGALCHMAIQLPAAMQCGFSFKPLFSFKYPALTRVIKLMFPRVFSVAAQQVNLIVLTSIASTIVAGSIAIFNFSNNLQGLLVSLIGASFAVAIFPVLSKNCAEGNKNEFLKNFSSSFRQIIFFTIPSSVLLIILAPQLVRVILGTGRFGLADVGLAATCLSLFSFSIFAQSLILLLVRAFFSFQNTKIPTIVAMSSVALNISLSYLFIWLLRFENIFSNFIGSFIDFNIYKGGEIVGLPLAFSISAIFQFIILCFCLYRKMGDFGIKEIVKSFLKILFATFIMGITAYIAVLISSNLLSAHRSLEILLQALIAGISGIVVYILLLSWLGFPDLKDIKNSILKLFVPNNVQ